jgi:hypothetical protein
MAPPESGAGGAVLSAEQQDKLNEKKVVLRLENEQYLREHPELKQLLNRFFLRALADRPDNVEQFAARWFTSKEPYEV